MVLNAGARLHGSGAAVSVDSMVQFLDGSLSVFSWKQRRQGQQDHVMMLEAQLDTMTKQQMVSERTPWAICKEVVESTTTTCSNKRTRQEFQRRLTSYAEDYRYLDEDIGRYRKLGNAQQELDKQRSCLQAMDGQLRGEIEEIVGILETGGLWKKTSGGLTSCGERAVLLRETPGWLLAPFFNKHHARTTSWSLRQWVGFLACFVDVKVKENLRRAVPRLDDDELQWAVEECMGCVRDQEAMERGRGLSTGVNYDEILQWNVIVPFQQWLDAQDETACKCVLQDFKSQYELSSGDFVKALLKIVAAVKEWDNIMIEHVSIRHVWSGLEAGMLKYIGVNQSLYL
jgi:hypothetical protein